MAKHFFLTIVVLLSAVFSLSARKPVQGVIITGQNNHNWPVSHQAIKMTLENSGLFILDVAISPKQGEGMSDFSVDFSKYKLVVLDYNGDSWPEAMNAAFMDYVQRGGGVVVYHAADNAFTDWKEYNEMIALGGWGGRNQMSGPYLYWKDGALQADDSPGIGGSHGFRHEFVLDCRNASHPIAKGLPARWKHASDELYDRMRGPGGIKDLLYTAYSSPEQRGSGREEPLIFTVEYGKGRIFHIMLGHCGDSLEDNPSMQCSGFQTLLLRGSEWCATGKVSQPVPDDFPTADAVSLRPDYRKSQAQVGNSQMYDEKAMDEALRRCMKLGYATIPEFMIFSGLKRDSAKAYLDSLCKGDHLRLWKVRESRCWLYFPKKDTSKE